MTCKELKPCPFLKHGKLVHYLEKLLGEVKE